MERSPEDRARACAPAEVAQALRAREPLFHRPELGTATADFEGMVTDDFWEVGASGRRYGRAEVLETLAERHRREHADPWEVRDFDCRRLGPGVYLVRYTLAQAARITRRATVWELTGAGWRAAYHQGTLVDDA